MSGFFAGVHYLFAGFQLIMRPGLKRFIIIPALINLLVFTILFFIFKHYVGELNAWAISYLPGWLQWLQVVIWLLFVISFFLIFIYAFASLGAIAASPFNGLLAEKVECYLSGQAPVDRGWMDNIKDVPRVLGRQFSIVGFYLPRALLIMLLFLVPVVHGLAPILWIGFSAWFLALQYVDFPTDNHRIPLKAVRAFLDERRAMTLGFGVSIVFVMSIPGLNLIAIPAAVAGAAKFWYVESRGLVRYDSAQFK